MPRNFFRRVEVVFPVEEEEMQKEILKTMEDFISDNSMACELRQNGKYVPAPKRRRKEFSVQNHMVALTQEKQTLTLEKVRSGRAPGESENQSKTNQEKT
jgi:polyphosphate kinase